MTPDTKASDVEAILNECNGNPLMLHLMDARRIYYALIQARASQQPSAQWIACSERMPEEGQDCLVLLCWDDQQPYIGIDTWRMGSERPLEFSSATIETGLEWAEHDYDEISHWMPLPAPPQSPDQRAK